MTEVPLDRIHAAQGITVPQFFNGRILSAEDLRQLLDGDRAHRRLLGSGLGRGVASGLRVRRTPSGRVAVTPGLALNNHGETIDLPHEVSLELSGRSATDLTEVAAGVFLECTPRPGSVPGVQNGFVLTVRPDSTFAGSAPADPTVAGGPCGPGYVQEGVRFRRVPFDPRDLHERWGVGEPIPADGPGRNLAAHLFLGSGRWRQQGSLPFGWTPDPDEILDSIGVEDCEVPLATFRVDGTTIDQLDMWGVRRRLHPRADRGADGTVAGLELRAGDLRTATGEATLWQFQAQLADELAAAGGPGSVLARRSFRWLPAAGLLPREVLGTTDSAAEFAAQGAVPFFEGVPHQPLDQTVSLDQVEEILRRGCEMPAALPEANWGSPLSVALVHTAEDDLTHGIFFAAGHPYEDRVAVVDLTRRVELLEAGIDTEDPEGGVVRVEYDPGSQSDGFLGANPTLKPRQGGLLLFRVLVTKTGAYRLSLSSSEDERPAGFRRLDTAFLNQERRPEESPVDRQLRRGGTDVVVAVQRVDRPFLPAGSVEITLTAEATEGEAHGEDSVTVRLHGR